MADVKPIPDGYPRLSPSLAVDGAPAAIAFYVEVLGAKERLRFDMPDGRVGHSELEIGDSMVMVADEFPEMGFQGPKSVGGSPVMLWVYVEDIDGTFAAAVSAGATEVQAPTDQFYGDRTGTFDDPWGHRWTVASHIEDLTEEEVRRRGAEMMSGG